MIDDFYKYEPYQLDKKEKAKLLTKELKELTKFHKQHSAEYSNLLSALNYDESKIRTINDIPFFPVRMFKKYDLLSIDRKDVFKTMTSSGTTGQVVSRIYLDMETAMIQQKVMIKIFSDYIGKKRLPMLIIDTPEIIKNRKMFTARGATIIGLNIVSRDTVYALNDDMSLNIDKVKEFTEKYKSQNYIILGFTFMVWQHLYRELLRLNEMADFSKAFLITSGGWKKLETDAVTREEFKKKLNETCGIVHFLDHYGMAEQTGCVYAECECGNLHASIYSDVIIRDYKTFKPLGIGERGIIQVVSALPHSYPGHSLLTEDEGMIVGEDDCSCGRKGKYIKIFGRIKSAEIRGCSDTYADKFK